jgi:3-oxoacyl-[acyl-carrier protein] reductase
MKKCVLVTGGATGIGKAVSHELAENGYEVIINYHHSKEAAETLAKELTEKYGFSLAIKADVSDEAQVDSMFQQIEETGRNVDIIVNNAAIDLSNLWHLKTADEFRESLNVNVIGAFNVAKRAEKGMMAREWGRIINIASTNGINTYYPMCADYDASKAALISLTHNLAVQYSPYVNVNAIAPGFIGTENELAGYDEEFLKEECEKILVKRYGKPEEVAHLVKFLISDEANYINNTVIRIDGGQMGSV